MHLIENFFSSNVVTEDNMNRKTAVAILFILAFIVALHQFYYWQTWFSVEDIHHETFVVAFICLALGIILSEKLEGTHA